MNIRLRKAERRLTKFRHAAIGSNVVANCNHTEICIEIINSTFHNVNGPGFMYFYHRALSNGANHNSITDSVCKLLEVVWVVPTQREQNVAGEGLAPLTAVATRIGVRPVLKLCRAASRSPWERSPWIQVVW